MDKDASNWDSRNDSVCPKVNINETAPSTNENKDNDPFQPKVSVTFNHVPPQIYPYLPGFNHYIPPPQPSYWPPNILYNEFLEKTALENDMIAGVKRIHDILELNPKLKTGLVENKNSPGYNDVQGANPRCHQVCQRCVECQMPGSYSHPFLNNVIYPGKCFPSNSYLQDCSHSCRLLCQLPEHCWYRNSSPRPHYHYSCTKSCDCSDWKHTEEEVKNVSKRNAKNNSPSDEDVSTFQFSSESEDSLASTKIIRNKRSESNRMNKRRFATPHGESDCERSCNLEKVNMNRSQNKKPSKRKSKTEEEFTRENPRIYTTYFLPA